jgi:hypothetical protein
VWSVLREQTSLDWQRYSYLRSMFDREYSKRLNGTL